MKLSGGPGAAPSRRVLPTTCCWGPFMPWEFPTLCCLRCLPLCSPAFQTDGNTVLLVVVWGDRRDALLLVLIPCAVPVLWGVQAVDHGRASSSRSRGACSGSEKQQASAGSESVKGSSSTSSPHHPADHAEAAAPSCLRGSICCSSPAFIICSAMSEPPAEKEAPATQEALGDQCNSPRHAYTHWGQACQKQRARTKERTHRQTRR